MDLLWVGDHRAVSAGDLDRVGAHPLCELPFGIFQAGVPITSSNVDTGRGCCTAYMTFALTGSISAAK
jgi:hypothetical protein